MSAPVNSTRSGYWSGVTMQEGNISVAGGRFLPCVKMYKPDGQYWLCSKVAKDFDASINWIRDEQRREVKHSWTGPEEGRVIPVNLFQSFFPALAKVPDNIVWDDK